MSSKCFQFTLRSFHKFHLYGGGALRTTASVLYYFIVFGVAYGHCSRHSVRFHPRKGIWDYINPERSSSISQENGSTNSKEIEADTQRQIIGCKFIRMGEVKPLMPSHIRVDLDPLAQAVRSEEIRGGGDARSPNKHPSYRRKLLHSSKFHEIVHIPSSYYPTIGKYIPQNPTYLVPRVHKKSGPLRTLSTVSGHHADFRPFPEADTCAECGFIGETEVKHSTVSPYMGSRILASIPDFFIHIRNNLDALRELERLEEEQDGISGLMDSIESEDHLQSRHRQNQPEDLPMMRIGEEFTRGVRTKEAEEATSDLLKYMGRDPKYRKANGHNPSWLFTGLGLGKRSGHEQLG